jgi:rubrerythrin
MKFDQAEIEKMVDEAPAINEQVKAFVDQIEADNETLFVASENQVKEYYTSITDRKQLAKHFIGRMVCERMNMIELANKVINAGPEMDPKELQLLSKQVLDEANHFRMVKDVVEYLNQGPIDLKKHIDWEMDKNTAIRGAKLLTKYECTEDELALSLYQLIAEGRAARNWQMMADTVSDPFVAKTYNKIAKDEKFHSKMGRRKLLQICDTPEKQERVLELANQMRLDLFEINCANTVELAESRRMIEAAYGKTTKMEDTLDTSYSL